jgi:hypothetical protein
MDSQSWIGRCVYGTELNAEIAIKAIVPVLSAPVPSLSRLERHRHVKIANLQLVLVIDPDISE